MEVRGTTKILVVDDDQAFAYLLQQVLKREGYSVDTANDSENGFKSFLAFKPDLIITDIQVPPQSGLELVRRLRVHDSAIRAIYMSGQLRQHLSQLEEEANGRPAAFLEKPFSKDKLIQLISDLLRRNRNGHEEISIIHPCRSVGRRD